MGGLHWAVCGATKDNAAQMGGLEHYIKLHGCHQISQLA